MLQSVLAGIAACEGGPGRRRLEQPAFPGLTQHIGQQVGEDTRPACQGTFRLAMSSSEGFQVLGGFGRLSKKDAGQDLLGPRHGRVDGWLRETSIESPPVDRLGKLASFECQVAQQVEGMFSRPAAKHLIDQFSKRDRVVVELPFPQQLDSPPVDAAAIAFQQRRRQSCQALVSQPPRLHAGHGRGQGRPARRQGHQDVRCVLEKPLVLAHQLFPAPGVFRSVMVTLSDVSQPIGSLSRPRLLTTDSGVASGSTRRSTAARRRGR